MHAIAWSPPGCRTKLGVYKVSISAGFPGLPQGTAKTKSGPPRVCIATYEIAGPDTNGGIGTAYFSLAHALASAGHAVTILHLSRDLADADVPQWREYFRKYDITFVPLPRRTGLIDAPANVRTAYEAYLWLRETPFDIVHFPELRGHGYYSILAKHQGHAFHNSVICIGTHSPISWIRRLNRELIDDLGDLACDYMERESVALVDVAISPSRYMLQWMRNDGWKLPAKCYVQQYIMPPQLRSYWDSAPRSHSMQPIEEIVFFGRLEERKGIRLFCDALDRLVEVRGKTASVTFLGKPSTIERVNAEEYISRRAKSWPWKYTVIGDLNHEGAINYLREGKRIAVMPSLEDNLPNTVIECLFGSIPFLASRVGGIPELIAPAELEHFTFDPDPQALANRVEAVLRNGANLANPAVEPDANRREWVTWHEQIVAQESPTKTTHAVPSFNQTDGVPKVTVCLVHHDRPELLLQAVASIECQDWPHIELIVVDDGSTLPESEHTLDRLERRFALKGWKVVRQKNAYVGAARNTAARHASGEYLLFMDDDNVAKPNEVSSFVNAALYSGAEVLSCLLDFFSGQHAPETENYLGRFLFLGGAVLPSIFRNFLGDSNFFIKAAAFNELGGFTEDRGVTCEDWEFLARAVLRGFRLEVVPQALVWYRVLPDSMFRTTDEYDNRMRSLRPYLEVIPAALRGLVPLALSLRKQLDSVEQANSFLATNGTAKSSNRELERLAANFAALGNRKFGAIVERWDNYQLARAHLPANRMRRIPRIVGILLKGDYHRYAHGLGSAIRDLRKAPKLPPS